MWAGIAPQTPNAFHHRDMILVPTQVRPSAIHGMGLFTVEPIAKGTPFWRFHAGFDQVFARKTEIEGHPLIRPPGTFSPIGGEGWESLPETTRRHLRWFGWVSREDGSVILSGDHACFMNHSPAPNTGLPEDATPPFTTVALRDIAAGEELTCDYHAFDADAAWKLARSAAPPDQAGR